MKKLALLFTAVLLLTALAACNGEADDEPAIEPTVENQTGAATPTLEVLTKEVPTFIPSAYPAFSPPVPPGSDAGYPVFTPQPFNPYPGGLATILHPMGLQCEEAIFPDLSAAISSLEEAGIVVVAAEEIGLEVCEACGCATSRHFQLQINAEDLDRALELGWTRRSSQ